MKKQTLAELLRAPLCCAALWFSFAATPAGAQTTSPSTAAGTEAAPDAVTPTDEEEADETLVVLDPFVVSAEEDAGSYRATSTLAGTRVRTDLKDVASSISVVTAEFLRDTGATNNQTLLQYTTNTEVGGIYGNYAGVGSTFIEGASEGANFANPSTNTRVRGLNQADNTRDYFLTDIPWDSYIVGRVDLQRGPNSILFGIGSPSGVINSNVNIATMKTGGMVENRFDQFGSLRWVVDYNHVLIEDELSIRFSALDDNTKYSQKPAYNHDQRIFGAISWNPSFLKTDSASTLFRANFENGTIEANRPRVLPPWDRITPFFDPGAFNRQTYDPYYAWAAGIIGYPPAGTSNKNFWLVQYPGPGVQATANPMFMYDDQYQLQPSLMRQAGSTTYWGLNTAGVRDGGIDGFPYGSNVGIGSYNEMAYNDWRTNGNAFYPGADKGFYKSKSLTDTSIYNFYDNLIDGPNKWETQDWQAYNLSATQNLLNDRLNINFTLDHQEYDDAQSRNVNDSYISVDVREYFLAYPSQYADLAQLNPNAGRAFIGGAGSNSSTSTIRDAYRLTVRGDVRASDFMDDGLFTDILGRHIFTGLYSADDHTRETRDWVKHAVDSSWSDVIGAGTYDGGSNSGGLVNGDQRIDTITYLTDSLKDVESPRGLRIGRIRALQSPHGTYMIPYFDSHWNATGVDPATQWHNPARDPDVAGADEDLMNSFEADNPYNYVGYVNGDFDVRNADRGDRDRLYRSSNKTQKKLTSKAITWQGFFWDDTVVATFGWRTDKQKQRSGSSQASPTPDGVATINPPLDPLDPATGIIEDDSRSYGIVVHTPKQFRDKLPYRTNISLTYSNGQNASVENRYDFNGQPLPNQKGYTEDVGVVLSMLDDKLVFKATYYETEVKDANISSVTTQAATLGNNTYYLYLLEAWGTASALLDVAGRQINPETDQTYVPGWEWYWNWALVDGGWDSQYNDPRSAAFLNHPSTIAQTAAINSWLSQLPSQDWFDAYGINIDREAAAAGDWQNAIVGWTPTSGVGGVQASGGGRVNGSWPTGTVDNLSRGWEFELIGQPTRNLNVSLNVSKTHASQTSLGASLVDYLEAANAKYRSPAGDLRLWWGGDAQLEQYWDNNIWAAYQFQLQTNGKLVSELAPWRANIVMNYNFDDGILKGANVGLGYRWQDKRVLGYALNDDPVSPNLDVDKPYWSSTEDWLDMWAGYQRKLSDKITWRIQANVRNVGKSAYLSKLSVQPNGQAASYKISEGMTWQLSNSFSF